MLPADFADLTGLTLLVVEDDHDSLEMLLTFLTACGAHVLQAGTGRAALAYVDTAPKLDAIITDLKMPEMDGVALVQQVRRHRSRGSLPAIALTGFYEEFEHAKANRFDAFLMKPPDLDKLSATIKKVVGRSSGA